MDTFLEQLVVIKRGAKYWLSAIGLWIAAIVVSAALFLFIPIIATFGAAGALFGAYYLTKRLYVEYEYIITNGAFDIDKILGKSSRKRIITFELSAVEVVEKFNPNKNYGESYTKKIYAADLDDKNAVALTVRKDTNKFLIVISPNERTNEAMIKYIPRIVYNGTL